MKRLAYRLTALGLLGLIALGVWPAVTYFGVQRQLHHARQALTKDRLDEARTHLAKALELWPDSAATQFLAARTARRAGAYEDAERHRRRSRELGWAEEAVALEEMLAEAQRDPRPHEVYLWVCVRRDHPDSEDILEALARGYLQLFDVPRVLEVLDLWLGRNPNAVRALVWRGEACARLRQQERARQDFQRAVDLDPEQDPIRLHLAQSLLRLERVEEATGHFERLFEREPGHPEVLRGLARCRQSQGRREDAERLLEEALAEQPDDAQALTQRGLLALEAGRPSDAEDWLRRAVKQAPFERETVFNLARCLQAVGKTAEARTWLDRFHQVDADLGQVKKAVERVRTSPRDPEPRCEVGEIFLRNAQEKEGLRWLHSALQCEPGHRRSHQVLADYYEKQGRSDLAARHRQLAQ